MDARDTYAVSRWLFVRLLALVYFFAFWSLALQITALVGSDGILPAREYMTALRLFADDHQIGINRFHLWPTLCWFGTSDRFLQLLCVGGVAMAALLLLVGVAPALLLLLLWVDYLSLSLVCRDFLSFQWDALLLETGLLAVVFAPAGLRDRLDRAADPPRVARWLLWWLLFRLMFGSGVVKLASGDPTWRGLTALTVHYETQPLPTPIAWYVALLPAAVHKVCTAIVLGIELAAPWFLFGPRRLRLAASGILAGLQAVIALTGNYAFFNLLSLALIVLLVDDRAFASVSKLSRGRITDPPPRRAVPWPSWVLACLTVPTTVVILAGQLGIELPGSAVIAPLADVVEPSRSVNSYGLFAVMTTTRPEIIVEGSDDGVTWLAYEFKDKPGDMQRALPVVAPFQPRLDWQMWFAALGRYEQERWYQSFCLRLLEGKPAVVGLLARDPFHGKGPKFVRGVLYRYRFSGRDEHRATGAWWIRERLGPYSPPMSLGQ